MTKFLGQHAKKVRKILLMQYPECWYKKPKENRETPHYPKQTLLDICVTFSLPSQKYIIASFLFSPPCLAVWFPSLPATLPEKSTKTLAAILTFFFFFRFSISNRLVYGCLHVFLFPFILFFFVDVEEESEPPRTRKAVRFLSSKVLISTTTIC